MSRRIRSVRIVCLALSGWLAIELISLGTSVQTQADEISCELFRDSAGTTAWLHPKSFVDRAVCPGNPGCPGKVRRIRGLSNHPSNAIGPPSYRRGPRNSNPERRIYSLGCRRSAVWEFVDNLIVDVPGPDIFVFEVGRAREPTHVDVSIDGSAGNWVSVGTVVGAKGSVDIENYVEPGQAFHFVRLTDRGSSCGNPTAGADIDAIAAAAYSWQRTIDASVTFPIGEWILRDDALQRLDRFFSDFPDLSNHRLRITGHTDSDGTSNANLKLSINRAGAVKQFIVERRYMTLNQIEANGKGEGEPIAPNATPQGRARNRRVELLFIPLAACPQALRPASRRSHGSRHRSTRRLRPR